MRARLPVCAEPDLWPADEHSLECAEQLLADLLRLDPAAVRAEPRERCADGGFRCLCCSTFSRSIERCFNALVERVRRGAAQPRQPVDAALARTMQCALLLAALSSAPSLLFVAVRGSPLLCASVCEL